MGSALLYVRQYHLAHRSVFTSLGNDQIQVFELPGSAICLNLGFAFQILDFGVKVPMFTLESLLSPSALQFLNFDFNRPTALLPIFVSVRH
jgi:hypothetical protein